MITVQNQNERGERRDSLCFYWWCQFIVWLLFEYQSWYWQGTHKVFFTPIWACWQSRWCPFFSHHLLFLNQATVWQEPTIWPASIRGLEAMNVLLSVCVHVCSPSDGTLYILVDGETGMIFSEEFPFFSIKLSTCIKRSDYALCGCASHFPL